MIPTIAVPTYETKLLSQSKPVRYRPFLVKEEKLLLMAQQGEDPAEIERAVVQILKDCTFGALDIESLPSFDVELLFLQLRAKSVNNIVELRYECKNKRAEAELPVEENDDGLCHKIVTVPINLDEIKVTIPEGHTRKIMLTDTLGVTLKYPSIQHIKVFTDPDHVNAAEVIGACLETVFQTDGTVHEVKDASPEEIKAFVDSLTFAQAKKIETFFETLPQLRHTFEFKCPKCGYTEEITLTGLLDFFD